MLNILDTQVSWLRSKRPNRLLSYRYRRHFLHQKIQERVNKIQEEQMNKWVLNFTNRRAIIATMGESLADKYYRKPFKSEIQNVNRFPKASCICRRIQSRHRNSNTNYVTYYFEEGRGVQGRGRQHLANYMYIVVTLEFVAITKESVLSRLKAQQSFIVCTCMSIKESTRCKTTRNQTE